VHLAALYSNGRDMEKAISSNRWFLENCNRHEVKAIYVILLSDDFDRFEKLEYTIEVLEGSMDLMETFVEKDQVQIIIRLVCAYIGCGEFLKATSAIENSFNMHRWVARFSFHAGRIEEGLCNYEAAIAHFRKTVAELQMQEYNDSLKGTRIGYSLVRLAKTRLLQHSAENEAEAFAIFQEELDRCVVHLIERRYSSLQEQGKDR